jgi:hypothetical protein
MVFEDLKTSIQQRILLLTVGAVIISFFPLKTDKVVMKNFYRGLSIQTSKREPPRIAFNEAMSFTKTDAPTRLPSTPTINLNENVEQKFLNRTVTLIKSQKINLPGMMISRSQILEELHETERQKAQAHETMIAEEAIEKELIDSLPAQQRTRLLLAQEKSQVLDQDWKSQSWQQALASQLANVPAVGPKSTQVSSRTVYGQILLQQGLGLGDGYIDIRYIKDRIAQSSGRVELPKNNYSIKIADSSGYIKATLFSKQGKSLGEGRIKVSQIENDNPKTSLIEVSPVQNSFAFSHYDFDKSLVANGKNKDYGDRGLRGSTYVASLDEQLKADEQGVSHVENVMRASWGLVRTEVPGYFPSLNLISAGPEKSKPIFREKFIQALITIAKEQQNSSIVEETGSVVWGQAKMDGKPQAGVQIDVEFEEDYKPIYFNQFMIPDSSLKATSENGYFAILHLPEGFYSLVATRGGQYFSHANIQAEPESVFTAEVDGTLRVSKASVKVFNAFSGLSERAQLEIQSLEEPIDVDGVAEVYLPEIERMSLVKITPENPNYISQMQAYSDLDESIQTPLIETSWLQKLRAAKRLVDEPNTSTVVGFVGDEDFEAYLPHIKNYSVYNLVYFDANGQIVESGKAGGGFVMFNVTPGTHSVVTVSKSTNAVYSQVIPVDVGVASVLQFQY